MPDSVIVEVCVRRGKTPFGYAEHTIVSDGRVSREEVVTVAKVCAEQAFGAINGDHMSEAKRDETVLADLIQCQSESLGQLDLEQADFDMIVSALREKAARRKLFEGVQSDGCLTARALHDNDQDDDGA